MNENKKKKNILFGIQPGYLHLGNIHILNILKNIYNSHNNITLLIADMHTITSSKICKILLNKNILFFKRFFNNNINIILQSDHKVELLNILWNLSRYVKNNEMNKILKNNINKDDSVSLYLYPLLMSCDILFNNCEYILVGIDQKFHIELTKNIIKRCNISSILNHKNNITNIYPIYINEKIMDTNNNNKMSKSNLKLSISPFEDNNIILSKINKIKTSNILSNDINNIINDTNFSNIKNILMYIKIINNNYDVDVNFNNYSELKEYLYSNIISFKNKFID